MDEYCVLTQAEVATLYVIFLVVAVGVAVGVVFHIRREERRFRQRFGRIIFDEEQMTYRTEDPSKQAEYDAYIESKTRKAEGRDGEIVRGVKHLLTNGLPEDKEIDNLTMDDILEAEWR